MSDVKWIQILASQGHKAKNIHVVLISSDKIRKVYSIYIKLCRSWPPLPIKTINSNSVKLDKYFKIYTQIIPRQYQDYYFYAAIFSKLVLPISIIVW